MIGSWEPVGMWVKLGKPVGTPLWSSAWAGGASPPFVHQRLSMGRALRAEWSRSDHPHIHGFDERFGLDGLAAKHVAQRSKCVPRAYQFGS